MKKFEKGRESQTPYQRRGRGGYRGRGSYRGSQGGASAYQPQVQYSQPPPPMVYNYPPPAPAPSAAPASSFNGSYSFKSQMRCNNCGERGHFSKECPRPQLPPMPK